MEAMGIDRFDTLALSGTSLAVSEDKKFYTIGRSSSGVAY